ncbi:hypothetical protein I6N96_15325 [Enterococcus sp. BWM-S5]|uniref:HTH cro/C1-type domain-containing protein n=1 Tax=Enterococcus larvae TaxID=2794352 RepID=A0ABS4CM42_9ENTE|nr:Rgg/GadR/MutR family transcriptional regulator [Enterococcus larvae]MBP1047658.1 hypothetical protein [Enterococcus larvae]
MKEETGLRFKYYRESKGQTINETAEGIVSPQFLRKFERGDSDISFTNLLLLLGRIQLTMKEFIHEEERFVLENYIKEFEREVDAALRKSDSIEFKRIIIKTNDLYDETGSRHYQLLGIAAECYYKLMFQPHLIEQVDLTPVSEYLSHVDQWGYFELFLISYTGCRSLTTEELYFRCKGYLNEPYEVSINYHSICDFVLHAAYELARKGETEQGNEIVDRYLKGIEANRDTHFIHYDLFANYVKGIIQIKKGDRSGVEECQTIIDVFATVLSYTNYANRLHITLETIMDSEVKHAES